MSVAFCRLALLFVGAMWFAGGALLAAETPAAVNAAADLTPLTVEKLTESARKSIVVITFQGRDGKQQGLGTGFVITADGLIATNLHVIGEARPIKVQLADGKSFDVTAVHAFDRKFDLALVKIEAKDLPVLPLGDSDKINQGQAVVALGNPHGLKHSVVSGIVSGTREIDGRNMLQLAMPIEPGNSGGPLLDMFGRVHGIITMKSLVTENLGFAVTINSLKPLLEKPNPTSMARWLTIGELDPKHWTPLFGARWRQRAGRILVDGLGQGIGGRSLCLAVEPAPEFPYELAVSVKLGNEEGAAGLAFCSDGGDRHFGFYPSNGKLRLSRFDGPDVFSWKVIVDKASEAYRPGEWNRLKVRLEPGKLQCFVNDKLFTELSDGQISAGKLGLAKFRNTEAEFKDFRIGKELPAASFNEDLVARIDKLASDLSAKGLGHTALAEQLVTDGPAGVSLLRDRAKRLEAEAVQLRKLAQAVHQRGVQNELARVLGAEDDMADLFQAALLLAKLDNDEVDVDGYRRDLERMAQDISTGLPADATDAVRLAALNKYLFEESGFHGSRGDYYHKSNSYMNEVMDDREGLPITLSVLYIELARKLGLRVVGVGLPGHFVVQHLATGGMPQLIDVYERGQNLSREDAEKMVLANSGKPLKEEQLVGVTKKAIIVRMLHNLLGLSQRSQDGEGMMRYVDTILMVMPDAGEERWMRAVLRFQAGRREEALADVQWLLEHRPQGVDLNRVTELQHLLERPDR